MSLEIAIMGAGPGGLVVAKALKDAGLVPLVFEASDDIGGQWHVSAEHSGIWKDMPTNTSRATTMFSDLPHEPGTDLFPKATDINAYLHRYARTFELEQYIRFNHRVVRVVQGDQGFILSVDVAGERKEYLTPKLIVATGRYNRPEMPNIDGLDSFSGKAIHAFDFDDPACFGGQKVLTLGNSISGLEIAAELAKNDQNEVVSACRKPRYIIQKFKDGVPADWRWFNRAAMFIGQTLSPEDASAGLLEQVVALHGNPADYGGLAPSENMMEAGIGQCQDYLTLVADGRIRCQEMPTRISGSEVTFPDGSTEAFEAIIAGTGYPLDLNCLSEELLGELNADEANMDLFAYTFAPNVPDLALLGQFPLVGPYFPVLELQARLTALVFSEQLALPLKSEMQASARGFHDMVNAGAPLTYHDVVTELARTAQVEPQIEQNPTLTAELVFGPILPAHFRLSGPGAWHNGEARLLEALSDIGRVPAPPTRDQVELLTMLAGTDSPWGGVLDALNAFKEID